VGHAWSTPVRWGCDVEVFGCPVAPGRLVHADKHGFLVIPEEDEERLLEAARYLDSCECRTLIPAARSSAGKSTEEMLSDMDAADREYRRLVDTKLRGKGEW